jgi:pectin methylesterase-like acyl-CoA thioesterase
VPLTNVVGRLTPFQRTTDALANPLPVTVSVNAAAPAVTLAGDTDTTLGTGFAIVNARSPEAPPPGAGVHTDTCAVPAAATSGAAIAACNCVPLTNVVGRVAPFHRTTDALANPLPVTVTVNAAAPAVTLAGDTDSTLGTGFAIVNAKSPEAPPPGAGVNTDTCAGPPVATSAASIAAWSSVELTNVVIRFAPFHRTTDHGTNWLP